MDVPPVSIPLRAASDAALSAFLRVSFVASATPLSFFDVEERDRKAGTLKAGVVVLATELASLEVKGVTRVRNDMVRLIGELYKVRSAVISDRCV